MKHTLYHSARLKPVSTCARLQHWHYCCILCFTRMRAHSPAQCACIKKKQKKKEIEIHGTLTQLFHVIIKFIALLEEPCANESIDHVCSGAEEWGRERKTVCVSVCVRERERRQSRGASEWETRERYRGSNVKHHQLCCDLTGWMYRLFVMSSVCVTHRLPGGGWGGEGGSKKRTRDSLGFVKVIAMQINCVWIAWKVCLHLLSVRIISHNKEDQRGL